jgi:hypothetical protein
MIRLQDAAALGGVRYGPLGAYHEIDASAPYNEINTENQISAYIAFRMLSHMSGDSTYTQAAEQILSWLRGAPVSNSDGKMQRGIFDPASHTLAMGAEYHDGQWVLQTDHPTDSGGTWTLSALGPQEIDALWGRGAAYQMWSTLRSQAGRTIDFHYADSGKPLGGLDYNDRYPPNESLISPEWTAGGLFALRQLIDYYGKGNGRGALSTAQIKNMRNDVISMTQFIEQFPNAYAMGPGFSGTRQGQTGFHWVCPPPEVQAMASLYFTLFVSGRSDPAAWWRSDGSQALSRSVVSLISTPAATLR